MVPGIRFDIQTDVGFRIDIYVIDEGRSQIFISVQPKQEVALVNHLESQNISFTKLGQTKGQNNSIDTLDLVMEVAQAHFMIISLGNR